MSLHVHPPRSPAAVSPAAVFSSFALNTGDLNSFCFCTNSLRIVLGNLQLILVNGVDAFFAFGSPSRRSLAAASLARSRSSMMSLALALLAPLLLVTADDSDSLFSATASACCLAMCCLNRSCCLNILSQCGHAISLDLCTCAGSNPPLALMAPEATMPRLALASAFFCALDGAIARRMNATTTIDARAPTNGRRDDATTRRRDDV